MARGAVSGVTGPEQAQGRKHCAADPKRHLRGFTNGLTLAEAARMLNVAR